MDRGRTTTIVIMGVSGSGKTTVMAELERRLGWPSVEADEFHPPANVEKMRGGHPLTDADRWPWLRALAGWVGGREAAGENALMTCSALRRAYRDLLRDGHPSVWFAELDVPEAELADRMEHRTGHYMPASLLGSQLQTLEPLDPDEPGAHVAADRPPETVADGILRALARDRPAAVPVSATQSAKTTRRKKPENRRDSAAELLGNWRAAERDTVAARTAASIAALAMAAASAAEEAALEAASAARAAMDAATRAKGAAEHAKRAATHAAEAGQMAAATAEGDKARADQAVGTAERAEDAARDRFHEAQEEGFPKE